MSKTKREAVEAFENMMNEAIEAELHRRETSTQIEMWYGYEILLQEGGIWQTAWATKSPDDMKEHLAKEPENCAFSFQFFGLGLFGIRSGLWVRGVRYRGTNMDDEPHWVWDSVNGFRQ